MKPLKNILIVILMTILFVFLEGISTIIALLYKIKFDIQYCKDLLDAINNLDYSNMSTVNTYMSLCYQIVPMTLILTSIFILIPLCFYFYKKKIKVIKKLPIIDVIQFLSLGVVLNIVISFVLEFLPKNLMNNYNSSIGYLEELEFIPLLISVGIIAPIIEELFFRFFMVGKLKNKPILAIIIPALLFGIAHGNLVQGTYAFLLGMIFAYIYLKTNNLLCTILLHMSINSSSVLISLVPNYISIALIFISFIICIYLFFTNKNFLKNK